MSKPRGGLFSAFDSLGQSQATASGAKAMALALQHILLSRPDLAERRTWLVENLNRIAVADPNRSALDVARHCGRLVAQGAKLPWEA
ncbi:hypothetical protein [Chromobacterium sp.]|uniref:hypothetical protein n=1 Tax=Chromobacterium sp. TaxID=306190 RepID=UPI0035ADFDB8